MRKDKDCYAGTPVKVSSIEGVKFYYLEGILVVNADRNDC